MTAAILRDKLKTLIVRQLAKEPTSGYGLIKQIEEATGWRPSYGSMYPMLEHLHEGGLISYKEDGRKKVYHLTTKGRAAHKEGERQQAQMFERMRNNLKLMSHMCGIDSKAHNQLVDVFFSSLERGEMPFKEILRSTTEIKRAFWDLHVRGLVPKHAKQINAILDEATAKLRRLT